MECLAFRHPLTAAAMRAKTTFHCSPPPVANNATDVACAFVGVTVRTELPHPRAPWAVAQVARHVALDLVRVFPNQRAVRICHFTNACLSTALAIETVRTRGSNDCLSIALAIETDCPCGRSGPPVWIR